jgi:hypothetical protein
MIRIGETYGPFRVLQEVERGHNSTNGWVQARFRVECTRCRAHSRKHYSALLVAESRNQASCGSCNGRMVAAALLTRKPHHPCPVCFDYPWRRKKSGCPKCKGEFSEERPAPAEMYRGRSNIADCESC